MWSTYLSLITPLLLHMILSEAVAVLCGSTLDATACTTITALLALPVAAWMYQNDQKKSAGGKTASTAEKKGFGKAILFGAACFAGGAALNFLWSMLLQLLRVNAYFSNQTQEELLSSVWILQLIGLGFLVPIAEELLFRGLMYRRMKQLLPTWGAVLCSSAVFALYHGNMIQIIFAFPMAIVLTLTYEKGGSLIYPILFHMGSNLLAVLIG
jgi:hypothetical protein